MIVDPSSATVAHPAGIVTVKRSTPRLLLGLVRDPLSAVPTACTAARMVLTHNFGHLRAYVSDPVLIHDVLVRNGEKLMKTEATKEALRPVLGGGILTADGATWRWQRQTLAPAFQHARLTNLLPAMIAAATDTRDRWLGLPAGTAIDLGHEMMHTTYRIILETMLSGPKGLDAVRTERDLAHCLGASPWMFVLALLRAPRWVPFPGKRRATAATVAMRGAVQANIAARRAAGAGPDDLIHMLLHAVEPETGRTMTDAEITDNILTFILAGHETTALALGWTFALLADHPDVVARLRAEIEAVTGGGPLQPHQVAELTYARQVVSEGMRLYPPAPLIARAVARDLEIDGVKLPAGSVIFIPIYALHRHESLWPQPEVFDPDRFALESVKARHRFAYMPFGAGPRICIGSAFAMIEAVAILAVLSRAVGLQRVEAKLPAPVMRITLRPKRPLRMRLAPR